MNDQSSFFRWEATSLPKVSADYLNERRQAILDAAMSCFARNGFHETTIQQIAREAGVSHGLVYRYFASKEEMVQASTARDREARDRRFRRAQASRGPLEAIDALFSSYIERNGRPETVDERRMRVQTYSEAIRNPAIHQMATTIWTEVTGRVEAMVAAAQAAGEIDPNLDPEGVARVLVALHDGLMFHGAIEGEFDVQACIAALRAMLYRGLATRSERPMEASDDDERVRPAPARP